MTTTITVNKREPLEIEVPYQYSKNDLYHSVYSNIDDFVTYPGKRGIGVLDSRDMFMVMGEFQERYFTTCDNKDWHFVFIPFICTNRLMMGWLVMSMAEYQTFSPIKLEVDKEPTQQ